MHRIVENCAAYELPSMRNSWDKRFPLLPLVSCPVCHGTCCLLPQFHQCYLPHKLSITLSYPPWLPSFSLPTSLGPHLVTAFRSVLLQSPRLSRISGVLKMAV